MQAANPQKSENDLLQYFKEVRSRTEELCAPLETEDYIPQPVVDVSPPKWNIAHTTWFFEEMILKKFAANYEVFDPNFGFLFNSYYNTIGERTRRDNRGDLSRPTVARVFEYRKFVDAQMRELISRNSSAELNESVVLGLNHEQQHQELFLTDLKFTLSRNPLFPVYRENYAIEEICEMPGKRFVEFAEGIYEIGYRGDGFCFDNELSRHKVFLNDFSIRGSLATNAEYLEFIKDGGYENFNLWHAEGWDWINQNAITAPLYWQKKDNEWFSFTLSGLRPEIGRAHV